MDRTERYSYGRITHLTAQHFVSIEEKLNFLFGIICRPRLSIFLYVQVNRACTQKPNPFMVGYLYFASFRIYFRFRILIYMLFVCYSVVPIDCVDRMEFCKRTREYRQRVKGSLYYFYLLIYFFSCKVQCSFGLAAGKSPICARYVQKSKVPM